MSIILFLLDDLKKKNLFFLQATLLFYNVNNLICAFCLFFRLNKRQKKTQTSTLLQGVTLPDTVSLAVDPLPLPRQRPSEPLRHEAPMEFDEPPNREGQTAVRRRKKKRRTGMEDTPSSSSSTMPPPFPPIPSRPTTGAGQVCSLVSSAGTDLSRGLFLLPIFRRNRKLLPHQARCHNPGREVGGERRLSRRMRREWRGVRHQKKDIPQYKGKWYCHASGQSVDEWRSSLKK